MRKAAGRGEMKGMRQGEGKGGCLRGMDEALVLGPSPPLLLLWIISV